MEINEFLALFERALMRHGFSKEAAHHHTVKVFKSLSDEARIKIANFKNADEVDRFATAYSNRIRRLSASAAEKARDASADTVTVSRNFNSTINERQPEKRNVPTASNVQKHTPPSAKKTRFADDDEVKTRSRNTKTITTTQIRKAPTQNGAPSGRTVKIDKIDIKAASKEPLTPSGKKEYAKRIVIAAIPAGVGTVLFSLPVLMGYILISALIAFFIAILVAVTVIGGILTFAGIIYGVIALFGTVPEGLYEIGLAFVILGVTLVLAISSYNIAVRWIPILWKKYSAKVTRQLILKLKLHLNKIRKECNDL